MSDNILWYRQSAIDWNEALPLGNGFMGAMCFGGTSVDRFQLNNDSVWWGKSRDRINPDAYHNIPTVRDLIKQGRIKEAEELANETIAATPDYQSHYEPLADLFIIPDSEKISLFGISEYWNERLNKVENIDDYKRVLDIEKGIHRVTYTKNNSPFKRESFISYPDKIMAIRCDGSPFRIIASRKNQCERIYAISENTICLEGHTGGNGVGFCLCIRALGEGTYVKGSILHCPASAVILISSQTDFYCEDYVKDALSTLDAAEKYSYEELKDRHLNDFGELMNRCQLYIECEEIDEPTDSRLCKLKDGKDDLGLINLAFAYGRYLLISSSREGSLPANLQGIWNQEFNPPWGSKYTININAQMNYWACETTGLGELHQPLFDHIKRMVPNGENVAKKMYGARGWMAHHNTDIWGDCAPQDIWPPSTYWQMGAAWLCLHILEHFRYTKDYDFIKEYLPIVKDALLFFEDTLIENENGELVVSPTSSPENQYRLDNGEVGNICEGASMDAQILYELVSGLIETDMLTEDEIVRYENILARIPKMTIEGNGTIQEWAKPYEEVEIGHRHISHLFALYPGKMIFDDDNREELLVAARKTLERRLSYGGGHTGWSRAWIINMWARLGDGEKCHENIMALLRQSMLPNLFDNHPPFQIDGNFGLVAGIVEMLMQSHESETKLCKALPKAWKSGFIKGLRSRHGEIIDITWENGEISKVSRQDIVNRKEYV